MSKEDLRRGEDISLRARLLMECGEYEKAAQIASLFARLSLV